MKTPKSRSDDKTTATTPEQDSELFPRRALSVPEFCRRYGVGRTMAYEEIAEGRLVAVKAGRRTLIPLDAAKSWLAALPRQCRRGEC